MVGMLYGMEVVITNGITKEVRSRTHKKRRIDKKWLNRYGYKSVPDNDRLLHIGNALYMTQKCYEKIKKYVSVVEIGGE